MESRPNIDARIAYRVAVSRLLVKMLTTARGVHVRAYEGASNVEELTRGLVHHADLTKEQHFRVADWVLCMEVAEHIPRQDAHTLMANLDRHNTMGIVLSWSWAKAGTGHVNPQPKTHVTSLMRDWNYTEYKKESSALQAAASYAWFKEIRRHGVVGGGMRVWKRKERDIKP